MKNPSLIIIALLFNLGLNAQVTFEKIITRGAVEDSRAVIQTSDGGYAFLGHSSPNIENGRWLVKTDYLGDTLWTRTFREIGSNYISEHSLIQATDGGTIASPGLYFYQVSCHGIAFGSGKIVRSAK